MGGPPPPPIAHPGARTTQSARLLLRSAAHDEPQGKRVHRHRPRRRPGHAHEERAPKVLHELCGRPMIDYVVDAALAAGCADVVVVVGHGREEVGAYLAAAFGGRVRTAVQEAQRGTGHAVRVRAARARSPRPSACSSSAATRRSSTRRARAARRRARRRRPARDAHRPRRRSDRLRPHPARRGRRASSAVREHRDASADEQRIREVNPGVYVGARAVPARALATLAPNNAQGELYLTDIVAARRERRRTVASARAESAAALVGINDRAQLAAAEEILYGRIADRLPPRRRDRASRRAIDASVVVEPDAIIEHGVVLRGETRIGAGARDRRRLRAHRRRRRGGRHRQAVLGRDRLHHRRAARRSARSRTCAPRATIEAEAHIGNFVETKKTHRPPRAPRPTTSPTSATATSARARTSAPAPSSATTTASRSTAPRSARARSSAATRSSSRRCASARAPTSATGTTVTKDVPDDALAIARVQAGEQGGLRRAAQGPAQGLGAKKDGSSACYVGVHGRRRSAACRTFAERLEGAASEVAHAQPLRLEVRRRERVGADERRRARLDGDAERAQRLHLGAGCSSCSSDRARRRGARASPPRRRNRARRRAGRAGGWRRPCRARGPGARTRGSCWRGRCRAPPAAGRARRPAPRRAISACAASSCSRQSHFSEPNTSLVRHSEWTRTGTSACPRTSPMTSAT